MLSAWPLDLRPDMLLDVALNMALEVVAGSAGARAVPPSGRLPPGKLGRLT